MDTPAFPPVTQLRARLESLQRRFPTVLCQEQVQLLRHTNSSLASTNKLDDATQPLSTAGVSWVPKQTVFRLPAITNSTGGRKSTDSPPSENSTAEPTERGDECDSGLVAQHPTEPTPFDPLLFHQRLATTFAPPQLSVTDASWGLIQELLALPTCHMETVLTSWSYLYRLPENIQAELIQRIVGDSGGHCSFQNLTRFFYHLVPPAVALNPDQESSPIVVMATEFPSRQYVQSLVVSLRRKPRPLVQGWVLTLLSRQKWVQLSPIVSDVLCRIIRDVASLSTTESEHCLRVLFSDVWAAFAQALCSTTVESNLSPIPLESTTWSEPFLRFLQVLVTDAKVTPNDQDMRHLVDILDAGLHHPAQVRSKLFASLMLTLIKTHPSAVRPYADAIMRLANRSKTFLRKTIINALKRLTTNTTRSTGS
ncbi:hypothetical protein IWQ62_002872 [Dispira parvispora]|uniref:Fanconi Anaemia group E protein C-terminal domain-containing protein n=1 Tax=Dispira parvispora TaxID=1520584 RepID=A0A9W8AUV2_9FUNG|nr:hypothetical protein IWQ62_002872 [Dispira parvispora]